MNRTLILTKRNIKEMMRDPISLGFSLFLPVVMLVFMQLLFGQIGEEGATMFMIKNFAPAIATFGFTFTMLYIALMLSGDRTSAFMSRLLVSPLKPHEYLLSFLAAGIPVTLAQTIIFYCISFVFGLQISWGLLLSIVCLLPSALLYLSAGIFVGSIVKNDTQAGPMCSIIITAAGLIGGVWMPIETIGGTFLTVCKILPFFNGVRAARAAVAGNYSQIIVPCLIVLAYTVVFFTAAFFVFIKKSRK